MTTTRVHGDPAGHDSVVVRAGGELDLATAGRLRAQLGSAVGAPSAVLVLDTSAVTFIDCSGLRELVAVRVRLTAEGRRLELRDPSAAVLRLLAWSGTAGDFDVAGTAAAGSAAAA